MIGGSLALAARAAGLIGQVTGIGRTEANLATAAARGIVDRTSRDLAAIGPADLVVVAVPVRSIAAVTRALLPHLQAGTVVTDVASVKGPVVEALEALLPPSLPFVGAHPIAGTELSGAAAANPELFRGARCVVTPTSRTDPDALTRIEALWRGVGMTVERMSPEEHDRALAWTSHLIHVLAYALAGALDAADPNLVRYAGPSLRGATRVAASSPEAWLDILLANATAVGAATEAFVRAVERVRAAISSGDEPALAALLRAGHSARRRLEGS